MNERRAWRAAPSTLVLVWVFIAVAVAALPLLGITVWLRGGNRAVAVGLLVLTVAAVAYAWRFGLHPRLAVIGDDLVISNPLRTIRVPLADVVSLAPGDNGLLVGTDSATHPVWCVQTATTDVRRHHVGRADQVIVELRTYLPTRPRVPASVPELDPELDPVADQPPAAPAHADASPVDPESDVEDSHQEIDGESDEERDKGDDEPELLIHRASRSDAETLAGLERRASESALAHVFPDDQPYPEDDVQQRWQQLLGDRSVRIRVAELEDEAVGYLAYSGDRILHLGVTPDQHRRGHGRRLLDYAVTDILHGSDRDAVRLWVLRDNDSARGFYRAYGFVETDQERACEFPPYPVEVEMVLLRPS